MTTQSSLLSNQNLIGDKQPSAGQNVRRVFFYCSIIAGITFFAFWPSLSNGFTNWDDEGYVVDNPDIKGCTLHNAAKLFSSVYVSNYQPLTMLSYMAEYRFFQLNPVVYHWTNLLLHIINCLLVFALIYGLSGKQLTGLLVALMFAVHPLRVESVAWIAERKDVLSAFFYFLSLLSYLRYVKKADRKFYGFCLLSLVLSLLSKPIAISQPFVLILIDYLHDRKIDKKNLLEKAPFFAVAALFAVITILTQKGPGPIPEYSTLSPLTRVCAPFYGMVFYVVKSIIPIHLSAFYPFPARIDGSMNIMLFASFFLAMGVAVAIYRNRGRFRKLVFGSLFFLITALPMLQIVRVGDAIVAERYTYIPMLGVYYFFMELYGYLLGGKLLGGKAVKGLLWASLGMSLIIFTCITRQRCGIWKDSISLWSDVINKFPCAVAYTHRGLAYSVAHDNGRAIQDYYQAIMLDPNYAPVYNDVGVAYKDKGDYDRAIENYSRAIGLYPRYARAYGNRGIAYKNKGDNARAIEDYTRAIALDPRFVVAYNNRGVAYNGQGDHDRAIEDLSHAIMLNPGYAMAYYNRGLAYKAKGYNDRARVDFNKACDCGLAIACKLLMYP
jgi:tetratricopeptide (TPR) repeat protein